MQSTQKGFTLVEILVIISIIGTLVGVVFVAVNRARDHSFDATRAGTLEQLQLSLKVYRTVHDAYPTTGEKYYGLCGNCETDHRDSIGADGWIPDLAPEYIDVLPEDPQDNGAATSGYIYISNGSSYKLFVTPDDPTTRPEFIDSTDSNVWSIASPGAPNWNLP